MSSMLSVAREANVAVSTVYMTLRHRHRVTPETRNRVEEAMRRVGYSRDKQPANGQPETLSLRIAFIYTHYALDPLGAGSDSGMSSYCRDLIAGIKESPSGPHSSITIFRGVDHVENDGMLNEQLTANEFDGVILFGADERDGYLNRLEQSAVPLVVINRPPERGRFSCVTLDYYGGGQLAIDHLVAAGHRRVALTHHHHADKWLTRELSAGARDALSAHGLKPVVEASPAFEVPGPGEVEQLCRQMIEHGATALFTSDYVGVRCADTFAALGVRVPEDFSIIGFDNRGYRTATGLALSSVGYDKRRMGKLAIRTIEQLYKSRGSLRWSSNAVATQLVPGETTAPPPQ